jgi:hypothetical protein
MSQYTANAGWLTSRTTLPSPSHPLLRLSTSHNPVITEAVRAHPHEAFTTPSHLHPSTGMIGHPTV